MIERLISVREVSDLTGWHPITIYKKGMAGEIPGRIKLGRRSIRFKESEIEEWLREGADSPQTRAANE